jgi:hypothetical protein
MKKVSVKINPSAVFASYDVNLGTMKFQMNLFVPIWAIMLIGEAATTKTMDACWKMNLFFIILPIGHFFAYEYDI